MSDVFISYSRKDKPFVQKLHHALRSQQRQTWVDWDAIRWTENWWSAIERGIEGTNTFVFVISPDSVVSQHCRDEIDHAVKHHKRLVPIVYRETDAQRVHPALQPLNWLFFRETDAFETTLGQLVNAIETDLEYVNAHTRILERAIEWDKANRNESFVLRGDDLKAAEKWLAQEKQPKPTELQRVYISASRMAEEATRILIEAGQRAEKLVQDANLRVECAAVQVQRSTRRARVASMIFGMALIGATLTGGLAWTVAANGDAGRAGTRLDRRDGSAPRQNPEPTWQRYPH